jgi:uracil-DNA glycosylase
MTVSAGEDARLPARQILEWHIASGADEALDEAPHDRFAEGRAEREQRQKRAHAPAAGEVITMRRNEPTHFSAEAAQKSAEALAQSAETLEALREALQSFDGCALKTTATRLVFADGNPEARVMLIGEGPGAEEDREGLPFVGRAGQLLDRMLAAIGLARSAVYVANIVPWRPPGNRTPTAQEVAACLPFIRRQIALSKADYVVCLGATPSQALLNQKDGITRLRGRWFDLPVDGRMTRALATLHPAYLLRAPLNKRYAWRDFRDLRRVLDEKSTTL